MSKRSRDEKKPKPPIRKEEGGDGAAATLSEKEQRARNGGVTESERAEGWRFNRANPKKLHAHTNVVYDKYYREANVAIFGETFDNSTSQGNDKEEGDTAKNKVSDWDAFLEQMRSPLPCSFWVNDTDPLAPDAAAYFASQPKERMSPIPWYNIDKMGWRLHLDKATLRRDPQVQELRQFIIRHTAIGLVSRQEEVSMIPPLFLEIQGTDLCLDMCASPGSKTAQMLVALGRGKQLPKEKRGDERAFPFDYTSSGSSSSSTTGGEEDTGVVVANEIDDRRANMLIHQVKRLRQLYPFAIFTNHDARHFPDLYTLVDESSSSSPSATSDTTPKSKPIKFDKILADVMCTGDGTFRKAPFLYRQWKPSEAHKIQRMQIHCGLRATHLLKVGGRFVYSTCSVNPVEDEAVVAQIVKQTNGAIRVKDAQSILPNLTYEKGITTWTIMLDDGKIVERKDCESTRVNAVKGAKDGAQLLHPNLYPPTLDEVPEGVKRQEGYTDSDPFGLTRTMRFFPKHCDGGGFFVAVLEKVADFSLPERGSGKPEAAAPETQAPSAPAEEATATTNEEKAVLLEQADVTIKKRKTEPVGSGWGNIPLMNRSPKFATMPEEMRSKIAEMFSDPGAGALPSENLVVRIPTGEGAARITASTTAFLVSKAVRGILHLGVNPTLIVVSAGLRTFAPDAIEKGWRISQESAPVMATRLIGTKRIVDCDGDFIETLLRSGKLKDRCFKEDLEKDERYGAVLQAMPIGAFLFRVRVASAVATTPRLVDADSAPSAGTTNFVNVYCSALRARTRVQLLVDTEDTAELRCRLGSGNGGGGDDDDEGKEEEK